MNRIEKRSYPISIASEIGRTPILKAGEKQYYIVRVESAFRADELKMPKEVASKVILCSVRVGYLEALAQEVPGYFINDINLSMATAHPHMDLTIQLEALKDIYREDCVCEVDGKLEKDMIAVFIGYEVA